MDLVSVPVSYGGHNGVVRVTQDYMGAPANAEQAQALADSYGALLPTRKLVDAIWAAADLKLAPQPIPNGTALPADQAAMQHQAMIEQQKAGRGGRLIAGHKKDIVLTHKLVPGKVAIYGWHQLNGKPIQPLFLGHSSSYRDYSQGVRLVAPTMLVDGVERPVADVLTDPTLAGLLSDEGHFDFVRYPGILPRPQRYVLAEPVSPWVRGAFVAGGVILVGYWLLQRRWT